MPGTCCSVPECHQRSGHKFPKDPDQGKKWVLAIRRLDETTGKPWTPSNASIVCKSHFTTQDYVQETIFGRSPTQSRLKPTAVPSVFNWTIQRTDASLGRASRATSRQSKKEMYDDICRQKLEASLSSDIEVAEELVLGEATATECDKEPVKAEVCFADTMTQTLSVPMLSVDNLRHNDRAIHFYTGLESYDKFFFVLSTLGPTAFCLQYLYFQVTGVSVENHFFYDINEVKAKYILL